MGVSGIFNIGVTAMQTTNQLLDIAGHNIANANTPGYTRQDAVLASIPSGAISSSIGATGNGVELTEIKRMYDSFVTSQLNTENSNLSYWNNYQTGISQIEDIFNEASTTGISPVITNFFNAWQNVAQNPQDSAQRTTLIQDAGYLSSRLNTASVSLANDRTQLFTDSNSLVSQVNSLSAQIAGLNARISGNAGALDLQDQRDILVQQLNQIVKVSTFQDTSGALQVLLAGTPLVQNGKSYNMAANTDTSGMMHFYVAVSPNASQGAAGNPEVTSLITGGQLKAYLDLRDTKLPAYINKLNAFAIDIADTVNYYQREGYGLNGSPGGNFFQPLSLLSKYTSVDSSAGVFTSPNNPFSTNGGTLTIKLGDNDTSPVTVNVAAGATLQQTISAINAQAGAKVTASVVNLGPATEFTVITGLNDTFKTNLGTTTVPAGTYTGTSLASYITANAVGGGVNVTYNSASDTFTIAATAVGGATYVDPATTIGSLTGFNFSGSNTSLATPITGTPPDDYRISIKSNPDGNLGGVRIGVTWGGTPDAAGSGLNLLVNSPMLSGGTPGAPYTMISSVSVTDPASMVSNAQYRIDYVNPFVITSSNNKINFTYNGISYTATLTTGYYNGSAMAKEIARAMNAAGAGNQFSVDYGITTPNKFTITNNGTASAQINWGAVANSATPQQFGFNPGSPPTPLPFSTPAINPNGGILQSESLASAFVISPGSDTIGFTYNGTNYLARLADGVYTSDGLAAGMQEALNAAGAGNIFAVDFGITVPNELTIKNTSGFNVTNFLTAPKDSATPQQFGFPPSLVTIPANNGTLSATTVVNSPYQPDSTGMFWRVMQSTDGSTWTSINPNTFYNSSNSSTINESQVNLANDAAGSSWRTLEFKGVKVRIDGSGGANYTGETFNVQPDPNAASDIAAVITDARQVAASTDTFTVNSTNNNIAFNVNGGSTITAVIPAGSYANDPGQTDDLSAAFKTAIQTAYQNATGSALPDVINVVFNPNTKQFRIIKASGTDTINFLWQSGNGTTAQSLFGFSGGANTAITNPGDAAVSDNPASVLSSGNQGIPGNNRNATVIANQANGNAFAGSTPVNFYNSLVADIGVNAASAKNNQQYQNNLVSQLNQRRGELSGVSMDQEAANLVLYQKAYQAAAQMITVANTMLATLLQMVSSGGGG